MFERIKIKISKLRKQKSEWEEWYGKGRKMKPSLGAVLYGKTGRKSKTISGLELYRPLKKKPKKKRGVRWWD